MKTLIVALAVAVSVAGLAVTDALAFSCPALQKAAETKDAKLHFQSEAQAKAAKALAEMAK